MDKNYFKEELEKLKNYYNDFECKKLLDQLYWSITLNEITQEDFKELHEEIKNLSQLDNFQNYTNQISTHVGYENYEKEDN